MRVDFVLWQDAIEWEHSRAALNQAAIPEGFALVPIEPTHGMQNGGVNAARSYNDAGVVDEFECVITIYKAMLAAAKGGE